MIIQIPVKNGYDGGYFQVEHRGKTRTFDHSNGSNRCFYTTIYYTGCGHQLTEVKNGWRLVLVFSLVWKWSRPLFMPLPGDEPIVHAAKEIERLLSPWRLPDDAQQRLLAVPLDYTYTKNSLSFSGLKGRDRLTASLLRSVSFVDLHLASIHRRTKPINDVVLSVSRQCIGETDKEEFYTEAWITARTDSNFIFHGLEIDFDSEVVLPMIHSNSTDGNTELAKFGSNVRPSKNASYQEAMLVVWPKTSTIDLACQHGKRKFLQFCFCLAVVFRSFVLLFIQALSELWTISNFWPRNSQKKKCCMFSVEPWLIVVPIPSPCGVLRDSRPSPLVR